jgi:hypothetical protein
MKGDVSLTTQAIFAGLLVMLVLTFVWNSVMVPAMTSYGNEHAQIIAQSLATSINSLSREEQGSVYRDIGLAWDVKLFHEDGNAYISVSHEKFKSGNILLISDAEDFEANNLNSIYVIKEPGKKPRLEPGGLSPSDVFREGDAGGGGAGRSI